MIMCIIGIIIILLLLFTPIVVVLHIEQWLAIIIAMGSFVGGSHQKKLRAKVKWSCDPLSQDVLAHHAQRTNYILFNVGIRTFLSVGASSQLVRMCLRWPNFDSP